MGRAYRYRALHRRGMLILGQNPSNLPYLVCISILLPVHYILHPRKRLPALPLLGRQPQIVYVITRKAVGTPIFVCSSWGYPNIFAQLYLSNGQNEVINDKYPQERNRS